MIKAGVEYFSVLSVFPHHGCGTLLYAQLIFHWLERTNLRPSFNADLLCENLELITPCRFLYLNGEDYDNTNLRVVLRVKWNKRRECPWWIPKCHRNIRIKILKMCVWFSNICTYEHLYIWKKGQLSHWNFPVWYHSSKTSCAENIFSPRRYIK